MIGRWLQKAYKQKRKATPYFSSTIVFRHMTQGINAQCIVAVCVAKQLHFFCLNSCFGSEDFVVHQKSFFYGLASLSSATFWAYLQLFWVSPPPNSLEPAQSTHSSNAKNQNKPSHALSRMPNYTVGLLALSYSSFMTVRSLPCWCKRPCDGAKITMLYCHFRPLLQVGHSTFNDAIILYDSTTWLHFRWKKDAVMRWQFGRGCQSYPHLEGHWVLSALKLFEQFAWFLLPHPGIQIMVFLPRPAKKDLWNFKLPWQWSKVWLES